MKNVKNTLKLSEHFFSAQGEGRTTGVPAYFIRLTDCNLSCGFGVKRLNEIKKGDIVLDQDQPIPIELAQQGATWICDSTLVWLHGDHTPFQVIYDEWDKLGLTKYIQEGIVHIIQTGGEPALPNHQRSFVAFLDNFSNSQNAFVEIETNGTIYIEDPLFNKLSQINCSPKLSNSGMTPKQRIVFKAIGRIKEHKNYQFKFVVDNEEDIKEAFRDFIEPFNIPLKNCYFMPALDNQEQFHEKSNFIFEMAKKYKFIATQRQHISAYGALVGV